MQCQNCGSKLNVIDSRHLNESVKRRRICTECGAKFFTIETFFLKVSTVLEEETKKNKIKSKQNGNKSKPKRKKKVDDDVWEWTSEDEIRSLGIDIFRDNES